MKNFFDTNGIHIEYIFFLNNSVMYMQQCKTITICDIMPRLQFLFLFL